MPIKVITAPTAEAITRAEAKLHLRVDDVGGVHPDDTLIDGLITAAREYAQHYTQRSVGSQVLELALDEFPADGWIDLERGPVSAITSVTYVDTAGATQTWASSNYSLDDYSNPARVVLAYSVSWPSTQDIPNAVKVRYTAGAGTVPKATKQAMLLMIYHWYENREAINIGNIVNEIPMSAHALLDTVKVYGF